ncbi:hypothetical protein NX059_004642 [Plenodomus lindquistii]|nr:hypothetical protein NX059_004642 [Plenodomus lindquistii]
MDSSKAPETKGRTSPKNLAQNDSKESRAQPWKATLGAATERPKDVVADSFTPRNPDEFYSQSL